MVLHWLAFKLLRANNLQHGQLDKMSPELEQNGFTEQFQNTSPQYSHKVIANPVAMSGGSLIFPNDPVRSSIKRIHSYRSDDGSWNVVSGDDPMDIGAR